MERNGRRQLKLERKQIALRLLGKFEGASNTKWWKWCPPPSRVSLPAGSFDAFPGRCLPAPGVTCLRSPRRRRCLFHRPGVCVYSFARVCVCASFFHLCILSNVESNCALHAEQLQFSRNALPCSGKPLPLIEASVFICTSQGIS